MVLPIFQQLQVVRPDLAIVVLSTAGEGNSPGLLRLSECLSAANGIAEGALVTYAQPVTW